MLKRLVAATHPTASPLQTLLALGVMAGLYFALDRTVGTQVLRFDRPATPYVGRVALAYLVGFAFVAWLLVPFPLVGVLLHSAPRDPVIWQRPVSQAEDLANAFRVAHWAGCVGLVVRVGGDLLKRILRPSTVA